MPWERQAQGFAHFVYSPSHICAGHGSPSPQQPGWDLEGTQHGGSTRLQLRAGREMSFSLRQPAEVSRAYQEGREGRRELLR